MRFKTIMIIKAIVCLGFGPLLLTIPRWTLNLLGAPLGSGTSLTSREYGAAMVGILLLTWLGRNVIDPLARRAITWCLFIYDALGFFVTLYILLKGGMNALGWVIVAVYLFFTLGFGYFLLPGKETK